MSLQKKPISKVTITGSCTTAYIPFHSSLEDRSDWHNLGALLRRRSVLPCLFRGAATGEQVLTCHQIPGERCITPLLDYRLPHPHHVAFCRPHPSSSAIPTEFVCYLCTA